MTNPLHVWPIRDENVLIYEKTITNLRHQPCWLLRDRACVGAIFHRNGRALPDFSSNVFGGTFGGAVIIPKLYNGRNKTFFFGDYEGTRQSNATTSTATMPTAQQRAGDFSNTRLSNGALSIIYNPFNT